MELSLDGQRIFILRAALRAASKAVLEDDFSSAKRFWRHKKPTGRTNTMDGLTGLAAVVMIFGMPTAVLGMYTFYRVRKLRTEERLAAMQRGVSVPIEPDLTEAAHSRRAGILLIAGGVGYMLAFTIMARVEPDALIAAAFGAIPFTLGLGYLLDSTLIRRDARAS